MAELEDALALAIERAQSWDYDLPLEVAKTRAIRLFECLAYAGVDAATVQVSIAADGAIAMHGTNGSRSVVVEIEPATGVIGMVVSDESARAVVLSSPESTEAEVVRELERAA